MQSREITGGPSPATNAEATVIGAPGQSCRHCLRVLASAIPDEVSSSDHPRCGFVQNLSSIRPTMSPTLVKAKEMNPPQVSISVTVYFPQPPQISHLDSALSTRYIFMCRINEIKQRKQDIQPMQGITAKGNSVLLFLKERKEQVSNALLGTAQKRVSCRRYSPLTLCEIWSNRLLLVQQGQVPRTWEARAIGVLSIGSHTALPQALHLTHFPQPLRSGLSNTAATCGI